MQSTYYYKIAKYTFWALFILTIWGTELPFSAKVPSTESSPSMFNQLLYSTLFITSLIVLIPRKNDFLSIIKAEKFLTIFIVFAFISMLWSDYSFTTFKRAFQITAIFLTCVSFLIYTNSEDDIVNPLKYIIYPYLVLTLIVILIIPDARGANSMWKGLTHFKNELGQLGVICAILCYIIYKSEDSSKGKILAGFMIFLSAIFTLGSRSSTSIISLFFLIGLAALLSLDKIFIPIRIGKTISIIAVTLFFLLMVGLMAWGPDMNTLVSELFGKDESFSGRTDLWEYLLDERQISYMIGSGYEAFWVPESNKILNLWEEFTWIPLQAHNGYLDILLSTGYIGLGLLIMILLYYLINFITISKPHPWVLFILITIITNFQESSVLRMGQRLNFIFIFSYLLLFINKYKNFNWSRGPDNSLV